jgi:hypothetical protein
LGIKRRVSGRGQVELAIGAVDVADVSR